MRNSAWPENVGLYCQPTMVILFSGNKPRQSIAHHLVQTEHKIFASEIKLDESFLDRVVCQNHSPSEELLECWNAGMLECWNAGMLECWNAGMLECWNAGMLARSSSFVYSRMRMKGVRQSS